MTETSKSTMRKQKKLKVKAIDVVVCNLYPFEEKQTIENIDVGGPTMVRSAAKNHKHVVVVVDPSDYEVVAKMLSEKILAESERRQLAAKAFAHLSLYDSQVARFLNNELFPEELTIPLRKQTDLRYGENPHQKAAIYLEPNTNSFFRNLKKESGRDLSLTNVSDINAGVESVRLFKTPAAVVIKHNTPCGLGLGKTAQEALRRAIEADPESAFGGVIVLNTPMDKKAAKLIASFKEEKKSNIDIVAVPKIDQGALELLQKTRKTMGIYSFGKIHAMKNRINAKWIDGGLVLQTADDDIEKSFKDWKVVSNKKPTKKQLDQMKIAWLFISRIRSNAIVVVDKNLPMTRGIGTGQTSRIRSTKIALEQAGKNVKEAILASDSFFPFDDSVKLAAKYKIAGIIQQGGSVNDQLSIDAANKAGMVMVFTSKRAFWH